MRVLITGARAPVAIEWAGVCHRLGWSVYLTDSLAFPLGSALTFIEAFQQTTAPRFAPDEYRANIEEMIEQFNIGWVIPTCEEIFYLAPLVERHPQIEWFLPDSDLLYRLHHKAEVFEVLAGLPGIAFPNTRLVASQADCEINNSSVLKPVFSRFGGQVLRSVTQKTLAELDISPSRPWVQQQKIRGDAIVSYGLFHRGRLLAHQAYRPLYCVNDSAATAFEPIDHSAAENFMLAFGAKYQFHGQVSFDYIEADSELYVIECNPRATSGLHFVAPRILGFDRYFIVTEPHQEPMKYLGTLTLLAAGPRNWVRRQFWHALRNGQSVLKPFKPFMKTWQKVLGTLELIAIALRHRISLSDATTFDIEFNQDGLSG